MVILVVFFVVVRVVCFCCLCFVVVFFFFGGGGGGGRKLVLQNAEPCKTRVKFSIIINFLKRFCFCFDMVFTLLLVQGDLKFLPV